MHLHTVSDLTQLKSDTEKALPHISPSDRDKMDRLFTFAECSIVLDSEVLAIEEISEGDCLSPRAQTYAEELRDLLNRKNVLEPGFA